MKLLLGCTKATPYLVRTTVIGDLYELYKTLWEVDKYVHALDPKQASASILNGSVCIECECHEALSLSPTFDDFGRKGKLIYYSSPSYLSSRGKEDKDKIYERSRLSVKEMNEYGKGKPLYAYHFENIKAIDMPFPVTELYRDGTCVYPLAGAPQSWRFAYRKTETTKGDYFYGNIGKLTGERYYFHEGGRFFYSEKIILISIRSPYVALEANIDPKTNKPFKDLEIRKMCISGAGIEYR